MFIMQEIFSIKLPGEVILGEGKSENQNHAIVFTRGEALQTIDMNQVNMIIVYSTEHSASFSVVLILNRYFLCL